MENNTFQGVKEDLPSAAVTVSQSAAEDASGTEEKAEKPIIETENREKEDRRREFERLITGEFKDLYDTRVGDTVRKRLRTLRETAEKFERMAPMIKILSERYGIPEGDIERLSEAVSEDTLSEEKLAAALTSAASELEAKLTNKIISEGTRPRENGISGGSPTGAVQSVAMLTRSERNDIVRRVARGEKITL